MATTLISRAQSWRAVRPSFWRLLLLYQKYWKQAVSGSSLINDSSWDWEDGRDFNRSGSRWTRVGFLRPATMRFGVPRKKETNCSVAGSLHVEFPLNWRDGKPFGIRVFVIWRLVRNEFGQVEPRKWEKMKSNKSTWRRNSRSRMPMNGDDRVAMAESVRTNDGRSVNDLLMNGREKNGMCIWIW